MLQQWSRRYVRITQPRYSPAKRARIRAFFSEGVDKLHLPWAVEALPVLLHLSLFLFFAGLLVYLRGIHHTVFSAVASWVGLCVAMYACITFMPILRHDSPYYAPLSRSAWYLVSGLLFLFFRTLLYLPFFNHSFRDRFDLLTFHYGRSFLHGPEKIAEETARKTSSETDGRMLTWTLDSLYQDFELEQFFSGIPSFCNSPLLVDHLGTFIRPNTEKLLWALIGWMDRTSTSHLVPKEIKQRRTAIFMDAMDAASLPLNEQILNHIFSEEWRGLLNSVDLGLFLRRRVDPDNPGATSYTHCAISIIISRERERDNRWFELTTRHLGVSGPVLRSYLAHGDSVLLANCIHITRYLIEIYSRECWVHTPGSKSKTFESVTQFDIQCTLPGLQHDFCDLWNETVHKAQNPEAFHIPSICILALRHLREAYISLHHDTEAAPTAFSAYTDIDDPILDEPSSYPLCYIESHRHRHQVVDSPPGIANITAAAREDTGPQHPVVSTALFPNTVIAPGPSTGARPISSSYSSNPSGTSSKSTPREPQPAIPIIMPSYPVSHESCLSNTPSDSAPRTHGVIAGAVESITGTPTILSMASRIVSPLVIPGAPSFSTPALSGITPTNPPLDIPTPTHPSTSASVSSVRASPTASISGPQVASGLAVFDAHEDAHNFSTPAKPPDKASLDSLLPPDKAIAPVGSVATSDSPHRHAGISPSTR
jgi:Family of unknown function (DUF6535)